MKAGNNKKILLVTWYTSTNCGTCLQSYALYSLLSQKYDVTFLGRRTYYSLLDPVFYQKVWKEFSRKVRRLLPRISHSLPQLYVESVNKQQSKYRKFVDQNYKFQSLKSIRDYNIIMKQYDCFMIGSDQLWNPRLYSTTFMLDFVPSNKRKVSYAASFGVDNIPIEFKHKYKKLLNRLDEISVREPRAQELVREISGRNSKVVLDPTFLKTPTEWREFANQYSQIQSEYEIPDRYIVSYFIGSSEFNHLDIVKQIARKLGCRIVVIPNKIEDYIADKELTIIYEICSYDFIHLIDNAQLVCTDSFHSVVFSFLLDKDFFIFPRFKEKDKFSQNSRLDNILNLFHLDGHRWADEWLIRLEEHLGHDYAKSYKILDKLRTECKEYLLNLPQKDN